MESKDTLIEGVRIPLDDPEEERHRVWEENHKIIARYIHKCVKEEKYMPTITKIALGTGISRKTVRKHIDELAIGQDVKEYTRKYNLMITEILNQVCSQALYGNVKASRLFMELMGLLKTNQVVNNNFINRQNNIVQLNNIQLTDELIKNLNPDQVEQIERIIESEGYTATVKELMK